MHKLPLFISQAAGPSLDAAKQAIHEVELFIPTSVVYNTEVLQQILNSKPCICIVTLINQAQSIQVFQFLEELKQAQYTESGQTRDGSLRLILLSEDHKISIEKCLELGIHELINAPVLPKTLAFKLTRHYYKALTAKKSTKSNTPPPQPKQIPMVEKKHPWNFKLYEASAPEDLHTHNTIVIQSTTPIFNPSKGIWKLQKPTVKKQEETWEWRNFDQTEKQNLEAKTWTFSGYKPEYDTDKNQWIFESEQPLLQLQESNTLKNIIESHQQEVKILPLEGFEVESIFCLKYSESQTNLNPDLLVSDHSKATNSNDVLVKEHKAEELTMKELFSKLDEMKTRADENSTVAPWKENLDNSSHQIPHNQNSTSPDLQTTIQNNPHLSSNKEPGTFQNKVDSTHSENAINLHKQNSEQNNTTLRTKTLEDKKTSSKIKKQHKPSPTSEEIKPTTLQKEQTTSVPLKSNHTEKTTNKEKDAPFNEKIGHSLKDAFENIIHNKVTTSQTHPQIKTHHIDTPEQTRNSGRDSRQNDEERLTSTSKQMENDDTINHEKNVQEQTADKSSRSEESSQFQSYLHSSQQVNNQPNGIYSGKPTITPNSGWSLQTFDDSGVEYGSEQKLRDDVNNQKNLKQSSGQPTTQTDTNHNDSKKLENTLHTESTSKQKRISRTLDTPQQTGFFSKVLKFIKDLFQ